MINGGFKIFIVCLVMMCCVLNMGWEIISLLCNMDLVVIMLYILSVRNRIVILLKFLLFYYSII